MKAVIFAILSGLCFGIGEVCTKAVFNTKLVGPFTALFVRGLCMAAAMALAYVIAMHVVKSEPPRWWRAETPTLLKLFLGTGLAAGVLGVLFLYLGLSVGEVSTVKPIAFVLAPATAVLIGWLVMGESMSFLKGLGVALILAGVVLVTTQQKHAPATLAHPAPSGTSTAP